MSPQTLSSESGAAKRKRGEEPSLGRADAGLCNSLCQKHGFGDRGTCGRGRTRGLSPGRSRKGEHQPHCFHWPSRCLQVSPQLTCLPPLDHSGSGLRDFPPRESRRNGNLSKICLSRTLWFPLLSGTSESLGWHLYSLHLQGYDLPPKQAWMSDTRRPLSILRQSCQASVTHSHLGGFSHLSGRERACLLGSGHG